MAVLESPDVRDRLANQGVDATPSTPEAFGKLMVSDLERWAKVMQRAGIRAE